ncbi:amino acid ABC transporter substrate-binding protein (PAAT family) [Paracoccus versutus]|uniref:Amino acid ABC transporter substrate-binding protein (PAAT family) n=2 Tax=Paracoccaceae TaxID=31989 RepID=A0AAQ0KJC4_PARVE|nr:amino acid ABC transporter substrate-binding protein (PAAT family) [Paracoccus versutus]SFY43803.1 amino acid ABC transporter substrate-binding protein, PAAT family [Paracoccus pantotrophus]
MPCCGNIISPDKGGKAAPSCAAPPAAVARRRVLGGLAGWAAACAAPSALRAGPETWTMVGMDEFAPYNYLDSGRFVGADIDILGDAALRLGIGMRFVPLPWRRALLAPGMGEADGLFQLAPTPERFRNWLMVGPLRTTRLVFVVMADSPLRDFAGLGALAGYSVGVVDGFTYTPAFDASTHFLHEGSVDDETSLRKLLLRRADVVVGGEANLRHAMRKLAVEDRVRVLPTALDVRGRYVGFPRSDAGRDKAERLGAVLRRMHAEGRIAAILRHRLGG